MDFTYVNRAGLHPENQLVIQKYMYVVNAGLSGIMRGWVGGYARKNMQHLIESESSGF